MAKIAEDHKKIRLRKGDKVIVLVGKDKGKTGQIVTMLPSRARAVVSGVNLMKRHTRPTQTSSGGIIEREAPIHVSNIAMIDPRDGRACRVGYKVLEDGRKVRFAKRSGELIDA